MLEINALEFGFDRPLVKGLSFTVQKGQIRLLHGPSGCGKSTLLALISRTPARRLWRGNIRLDDDITTRRIGAGRNNVSGRAAFSAFERWQQSSLVTAIKGRSVSRG